MLGPDHLKQIMPLSSYVTKDRLFAFVSLSVKWDDQSYELIGELGNMLKHLAQSLACRH